MKCRGRAFIRELIGQDPRAGAAFKAMRTRGIRKRAAEERIAAEFSRIAAVPAGERNAAWTEALAALQKP